MPLPPAANPYTPGAGQQPAVLSGRETELADFEARLQRLERGRAAQCTLIVGLRGVGKTVLLNQFAQVALGRDWVIVEYEVTTKADLLGTLARLSRQALFEIAPPSAWERAGKKVADLLRGMEIRYEIAGLSVTLPSGAEARADASGDPTVRGRFR